MGKTGEANWKSGNRSRARLWGAGVVCLCLWLFNINVWSAAAQTTLPPASETGTDPDIQQLRIQVMPEFDDPRVLVIIQGRLAASDTTFPVPVTFRVPRGAQINQMAVMDVATGATAPQSFDARPDPDDARWSLVTYTLDNAHFFYEYYYDPLAGGADKQFTYTFSSPQRVMELLLEVQQPLAATDFTLDPLPTIARFDEALGFTYHQFSVGALAAGEEMAVDVSYTKTDSMPSVSREEVIAMQMPEAPPEMPVTAGTGEANGAMPAWLLVLLGAVILISVGGIIWYRSQPGRVSPVPVAERATKAPKVAPSVTGFCSVCGATFKPDARYCHVCGTARSG